MSQLNYILKRILQIVPVLFVVSILTFLLIHFIPGDPARLILGEKATNAAIDALQIKLGLREPLYKQYLLFMKGILTLDLGTSFKYQRPVSELLSSRFPVTLSLTIFSTVLALLYGIPLGFYAAFHKDQTGDQAVRITTLAAIAMPSFWVALLLMMLFGIKLRWLPVGGWGDTFWDKFKCLILPAITQSLTTAALLIRNTRNSVVDIMSMDYVDFARSKGIRDRKVKLNHIFRNSLISTVTLLAMRMASMLGGSVIIETVFALPGMGKLMVDAIFGRDYAVIQPLVLIFALMVLVINLLTDILYSFLDPRVKF